MTTSELQERTDEALFGQLRSHHDKAAFKILYERYSEKVYAYCLRTMESRETAEQVFEAIFSTMIARREHFRGGSFIAWLMSLARKQCLAKRPVSAAPVQSAPAGTDLQDALQLAIARLPEEFRECVELHYFDGFSQKEIAAITGVSESLVKIRLFRAKKLLLELLKPFQEEL